VSQHHSNVGHNIHISGSVRDVHIGDPRPPVPAAPWPRPAPDHPGGGGFSTVATILVVIVIGVALIGGGLIYANRPQGPDPGGTQPAPTTPSQGKNGRASSAPAAKTYPVRITYDHWFVFIPNTVTLKPGEWLRFTNESGRSCHLIATSDYLPTGQGRNPIPTGGTYLVPFAERQLISVDCEGDNGGITVAVHS
jgi:plastocyanin